MKLKKSGKKVSWWEWGFFLTLVISTAFIGVTASHLIRVREPAAEDVSSKRADNVKVGAFSTSREQLDETAVAYLGDYQTDQMSYIVYAISLAIMFEGTYTFLGYEVLLYIYFRPSRLDSGAVQLGITSFSVGTLSSLESEVLKYIKPSYGLSGFIEVLSDESAININIQDLENNADIYSEMTTIGLVGDQSNLDIYKKND